MQAFGRRYLSSCWYQTLDILLSRTTAGTGGGYQQSTYTHTVHLLQYSWWVLDYITNPQINRPSTYQLTQINSMQNKYWWKSHTDRKNSLQSFGCLLWHDRNCRVVIIIIIRITNISTIQSLHKFTQNQTQNHLSNDTLNKVLHITKLFTCFSTMSITEFHNQQAGRHTISSRGNKSKLDAIN